MDIDNHGRTIAHKGSIGKAMLKELTTSVAEMNIKIRYAYRADFNECKNFVGIISEDGRRTNKILYSPSNGSIFVNGVLEKSVDSANDGDIIEFEQYPAWKKDEKCISILKLKLNGVSLFTKTNLTDVRKGVAPYLELGGECEIDADILREYL